MVQLKPPSVVIKPFTEPKWKSNFVKGIIVEREKGERKADQDTTILDNKENSSPNLASIWAAR